MDCSPPGSSVHGIFQTSILEWISMSYSRGSSWLRGWTCISCIGRHILFYWTTTATFRDPKPHLPANLLQESQKLLRWWRFVLLIGKVSRVICYTVVDNTDSCLSVSLTHALRIWSEFSLHSHIGLSISLLPKELRSSCLRTLVPVIPSHFSCLVPTPYFLSYLTYPTTFFSSSSL